MRVSQAVLPAMNSSPGLTETVECGALGRRGPYAHTLVLYGRFCSYAFLFLDAYIHQCFYAYMLLFVGAPYLILYIDSPIDAQFRS